jgi:hypothetical protein
MEAATATKGKGKGKAGGRAHVKSEQGENGAANGTARKRSTAIALDSSSSGSSSRATGMGGSTSAAADSADGTHPWPHSPPVQKRRRNDIVIEFTGFSDGTGHRIGVTDEGFDKQIASVNRLQSRGPGRRIARLAKETHMNKAAPVRGSRYTDVRVGPLFHNKFCLDKDVTHLVVSHTATKITPKVALALARARPNFEPAGPPDVDMDKNCPPGRVYITTEEWFNSCTCEGQWLDTQPWPHPKFPNVSARWGETKRGSVPAPLKRSPSLSPSAGSDDGGVDSSANDHDDVSDSEGSDDESVVPDFSHISPYGLLDGHTVYIPNSTFSGVTMRREAIALIAAEAGARVASSPIGATLILMGNADNGVQFVRGCMSGGASNSSSSGGVVDNADGVGGSSSSSSRGLITGVTKEGDKDYTGKLVKPSGPSQKEVLMCSLPGPWDPHSRNQSFVTPPHLVWIRKRKQKQLQHQTAAARIAEAF